MNHAVVIMSLLAAFHMVGPATDSGLASEGVSNAYAEPDTAVKADTVNKGSADDTSSAELPPPYTSFDDLRVIPNHAFSVGEKLKYDIHYGPIVAGSATIEIPSCIYYESRKCYKVEFSMRSAPFFDLFFKVRDYYYSLIDVEGLFPWKFEQHIREGGYKKDFTAWFDQCNHTATTSQGGPYVIVPYTQDAVSSFFYARTLNYDTLKVGNEIHFSNFYENKVYPLDVRYLGRENVHTKAGNFHCQVIEPIIVKGGLFKNTGKITIWITDDSLKVPVKVKTDVVIGSVVAELVSYSGLAGVPTSKY